MTKKLLKIIIPVVMIGMLLLVLSIASVVQFNVANPFAVVSGLYQIIVANQQYAEIQAYPKVVIAKPGIDLESYMAANGFSENKEEQLGALRVFENSDAKQYVLCSANKYYLKWHWNE